MRDEVIVGCVWDEEIDAALPPSRLKYAEPLAESPQLRRQFVDFLRWSADWNCVSPHLLLKSALAGFSRPKAESAKKDPKKSRSKSLEQSLEQSLAKPHKTTDALTPSQRRAFAQLELGGFAVNLLDGLTGSGKTWVYFEAVARALALGKQALIMIPEIALTAQWQQNFKTRFGFAAEIWHSGVTPAERRKIWRAAASGEARVIVGARSALFIPLKNPGLIVVDEEHDGGYKQESQFCYHGRDMAVVRGKMERVAVILSSATPSLESLHNVAAKKYRHVALRRRFVAGAETAIRLIDMKIARPPRGKWLSPPLTEAVIKAVEDKGQVMLFINRRGYAPATFCAACQNSFDCPSCSNLLVVHRRNERMSCHYCGYNRPLAASCPKCGGEDLLSFGPGVERLSEEIKTLLPNAVTTIASSDYLAEQPQALERIISGEVEIVIGTQLVAKGHHFPALKLIGVVDADMGIRGGDLRAAEHTWQLLNQLSGRTGRQGVGVAMIQTHFPDHPVMRALALGDRDEFLTQEKAARRVGGWPPFGSLAALIIAAADRTVGEAFTARLAAAVPPNLATLKGVEILGPAPAFMERLGGKWRWRMLVKSPTRRNLAPMMRSWALRAAPPPSVRLKIDIDPYNFL